MEKLKQMEKQRAVLPFFHFFSGRYSYVIQFLSNFRAQIIFRFQPLNCYTCIWFPMLGPKNIFKIQKARTADRSSILFCNLYNYQTIHILLEEHNTLKKQKITQQWEISMIDEYIQLVICIHLSKMEYYFTCIILTKL